MRVIIENNLSRNCTYNLVQHDMTVDNILLKLCSLIHAKNPEDGTEAWCLLGKEKTGSLLFSWIQHSSTLKHCTKIGLYTYSTNTLEVLYSFNKVTNIIQATVNLNRDLLGFVEKVIFTNNDAAEETKQLMTYKVYLINLKNGTVYHFEHDRPNQIMIQFLYRKHTIFEEKYLNEKLLLFIHRECILLYTIDTEKLECSTFVNGESLSCEAIVNTFNWAQWDCIHQILYYIHYRKPVRCLVEGEEQENSDSVKLSPVLSGLQFHDDLPHETVLNIPMNLPHLIDNHTISCGTYEDDTLPLRIHDSSLDLQVVSSSDGIVCICHHYLYEPIKPKIYKTDVDKDLNSSVHFAYSVTLLHHSCIIHCIIPGIPWLEAKVIRPLFKLYGDHHMMVFIPGYFTHLLDIGINHEPCCHIMIPMSLQNNEDFQMKLVPLFQENDLVLNLNNLEVFPLNVTTGNLTETFKNESHLDNRLSIIHYLLVHLGKVDVVAELLSSLIEKPLYLGLPHILKEYLIGTAYASVQRNLPSDASQLIKLLSVTTLSYGRDIEIRTKKHCIQLSQDTLWNTAMMLLSPQQRIVPYRVDLWTRLWENLIQMGKAKAKFKPSLVADKLLVSLVCYQPEALSRSSTPLSPCGALGTSTDLSTITGQNNKKSQIDMLPFYEFESCTASKQEHIISVNLRELSMHLLKHSLGNSTFDKLQWQTQTPLHVHAVATRYVAAQLEQSKYLCQLLCRIANVDARQENEKGFILIDNLPEEKRHLLFTLLERYYLAVESIAFPLPQGFTSFFTFLGYRTLPLSTFLQYVHRNIFELQVDVMKVIMTDMEDTRTGIMQKLKLLCVLPRSRAKRLLNAWGHSASLMLRAREHALNILSGVEGSQPRVRGLQRIYTNQLGLAAFPSADRLSPLDTFLDLLTAKASLTDLDFGLLIEATITSTDEFF